MAQKSKLNTKGLNSLGLVGLILSTGLVGFLLTTSVATSGFSGAVNQLPLAQFASIPVLGAVLLVGILFLFGLTLSFVSVQSANDLWSRICAEHNFKKQDFYALVVSCGSIGFLFDKAILTSQAVPAMFKLSYAEFFNPTVLAQVLIVALVAITGIVLTFIVSKSTGQLWKIYSPTDLSK